MLTFLILLVVLIAGKFIFDSLKQSKEMKLQGGVRNKYEKLIQMILDSDKRIRIIQETNTFVNVGISGPAGAQSFLLYQTFGKLTVQIVIKNNPLLGNFKIERSFPENMDQEEIMKELIIAQNEEIQNKLNRR